jgi:hypothetical protein
MAKGQLRSNREPKKPKKDKAKTAPESSGSLWRTLETQPKDSLTRKK